MTRPIQVPPQQAGPTRPPEPNSAPPPPYRTPAWFEPSQVHQPCQCPRCSGLIPSKPKRAWPRVVLVLLGGVLLPLVSLGLNSVLHVLELGQLGTALLLLAVAGVIAQLVWSPVRADLETGGLVHRPPQSSIARLALLALAAGSCLIWGYLAIFFLPLLPISVLLIAYVGLGLCGLCPFIALAVGLIQLVRSYRAVRQRLRRRSALIALLVPLAAPPLLAAAWVSYDGAQRRHLEAEVTRIGAMAPHSTERIAAIAALAGQQRRLIDLLAATDDPAVKRTIAEVYHRLTDELLDSQTLKQAGVIPSRRAMLRPFAFLDGRPVFSSPNWWLPRGL